MYCHVHVGNHTFLKYLWTYQWRSIWSRMGLLYCVVRLLHGLCIHCRVGLDVSHSIVALTIVDSNAY